MPIKGSAGSIHKAALELIIEFKTKSSFLTVILIDCALSSCKVPYNLKLPLKMESIIIYYWNFITMWNL